MLKIKLSEHESCFKLKSQIHLPSLPIILTAGISNFACLFYNEAIYSTQSLPDFLQVICKYLPKVALIIC